MSSFRSHSIFHFRTSQCATLVHRRIHPPSHSTTGNEVRLRSRKLCVMRPPSLPSYRNRLHPNGMDPMLQNRFDQEFQGEKSERRDNELNLASLETSRSITSSPVAAKTNEKRDEERISLFWRVFGGTILSIVALIFITLYNNLANAVSDLRNDLGRDARPGRPWPRRRCGRGTPDSVRTHPLGRGLQGGDRGGEGTNNRECRGHGSRQERPRGVRRRPEEGHLGLEVLKTASRLWDTRRRFHRFRSAPGKAGGTHGGPEDLRRDEIQKVRQELGEQGRRPAAKASQDAAAKQLDETVKELQKSVQMCREKLHVWKALSRRRASP